MLCNLYVGNVLVFVMRMLSWVMIAVVLSICLIASKIFRCILDVLIIEFYFSGRISRVHFVVNLLFTTIALVACSMRRLKLTFLTFSSLTSLSLLLLILLFVFVSIIRSEIDFYFCVFVVERVVAFLNKSMFSLVWLVILFVFVFSFEFGVSSWRFWMAVGGIFVRRSYDCVCRSGTLK